MGSETLVEAVAAALGRGVTVLTGNQRAARILRKAVDERNREAGLASWAPPAVLPWSAWTASLWRRLLLSGASTQMLLNRTQEHALWRSVIAEDDSLATLRSSESLAQLAAEAWAVLARYRGLRRLKGSGTNGDTRSFVQWAASFEERCRERDYLPEPRLEAVLREAVVSGKLDVRGSGGLVLVGFDRILPSQRALLDGLRAKGMEIELPVQGRMPERRLLTIAEDEEMEVEAAARWVRRQLEANPVARLAVIVPDLEAQRSRIERVFREVLAPETQNIAGAAGACPYEFSNGRPLSEVPMIGRALDLLAWVQGPIGLETATELLLSAYVGASGEEGARAEFDAFELRKERLLRPEIKLDWLIRTLNGSPRRARLSRLLSALRGMQQTATHRLGAGDRTHGEWAEAVREILGAAQWASRPGEDSIEFQTRERWESTLDEMATLDFDGRRVSYAEALASLRRIAHEAVFAPESGDAPVQILGPEESSGQQFEAIWFLRAADLTWPPPVSGNPLIGWPLRRELGIPGSDATADSAQARRVTERIAGCVTETVVFSYARRAEDGEQRPSVAVAGLGLEETETGLRIEAGAMVALETVDDSARIPALPDRVVRGGAAVLKAQAACAFRAFSEHRLFSSGLEDREPGLNARERGNAVHKVLEEFWTEVKTQAALKAMTTEARRGLLSGCIDAALRKTAGEEATVWEAAYLETQRARLMSLGLQWLRMEERRAPFTVVRHEAGSDVAIGPLRLSLRVDRVDEVANGSVLMDYKTGDVNPVAWTTDRPDEPQLPLYAVLAEDLQLDAIVFGKVRPGKHMELTGYEETKGTLTKAPYGKPPALETQVEEWRNVLMMLATDFVNGDTRVSPKKYPETCEFCAQRLLCRLDVSARALDEEDDEEDNREDIDE
ncbi:RecB family exonuclease [Granulicella sibirica]|uniref:RecB family exonuclease n=1 Tax=Granulicella sibirica TaxID=2479048 RepID=A0A4Q0T306_9BACT|nr:RecB family exonuclease [Granulicella sibirica]